MKPRDVGIFAISVACFILYGFHSKLPYIGNHDSLILPVIGTISFIIPLVMAFDEKYGLGPKLDNGEIRKTIVISLTIVYIILLTLFFYQITFVATSINQTGNNSALFIHQGHNGTTITSPQGITINMPEQGANISLSGDTVIVPQLGQNKSLTNFGQDITISLSAQSGPPNAPGQNSTPLPPTNVTPLEAINPIALKDILTNFLYVFVIIIGFYFGSRAIEDFTGAKQIKDLEKIPPEDIARKRYAIGDMTDGDFKRMMDNLNDPYDKMKKLEKMHANKLISDEEFNKKKAEILSSL
jgi:hypothetical protein